MKLKPDADPVVSAGHGVIFHGLVNLIGGVVNFGQQLQPVAVQVKVPACYQVQQSKRRQPAVVFGGGKTVAGKVKIGRG